MQSSGRSHRNKFISAVLRGTLAVCLLSTGVGCTYLSHLFGSDPDPAIAGPKLSTPPETPPGPLSSSEVAPGDAIPETPSELAPIYFERDSSGLSPTARATLQDHARRLSRSTSRAPVRIEGHCDERGTNEYNLALGERRARTVRDYLVNLGVDPERLDTLSFGEELPVSHAHDEQAWSRNRRAEIRP